MEKSIPKNYENKSFKTFSIKAGHGKRAPQSKSNRAGLQFPVGRILRILKGHVNSKNRVGVTAAVYTAC